METWYELFTWRSLDGKPYVLYFAQPPTIMRVGLSKFQLMKVTRNENFDVNVSMVDEWEM